MLKLRKGIDMPIIPEDFILPKREPHLYRQKTAAPVKSITLRRVGSGNRDFPSGKKLC
jgi:hypothetical protein